MMSFLNFLDCIPFQYLTLEVPEILHYPEVPSGVKLTLPFIDAFYIFKFQLTQPRLSGHRPSMS